MGIGKGTPEVNWASSKRFGKKRVGITAALAVLALSFGSGIAQAAPEGSAPENQPSNDTVALAVPEAVDARGTTSIDPKSGPFEGGNDVTLTGDDSGFTQLSGSAALSGDGTVYTWSYGTSGFHGRGSSGAETKSFTVPTPVDTSDVLKDVQITKVVADGQSTAIALGDDGWVYTWGGTTSSDGVLGNGTVRNSYYPVAISRGEIPEGVKLVDVFGGGYVNQQFAGAVGDDGRVYTWGMNIAANYKGTLGIGDQKLTMSTTPVAVDTSGVLDGVRITKAFSCGGSAVVLALDEDGQLYSWGSGGKYGMLGDGTVNETAWSPVKVALDEPVAGAAIGMWNLTNGQSYALAWTEDGSLYSWGSDYQGAQGGGEASIVPVQKTGDNFSFLQGHRVVDGFVNSTTSLHMVFLEDGTAWAWGNSSLFNTSAVPAVTSLPTQIVLPDEGVTVVGVSPFFQNTSVWLLGSNGAIYEAGGNVLRAAKDLPRSKAAWFGDLQNVLFYQTTISPASAEVGTDDAGDTTVKMVAPAYGGEKETSCTPVPVTANWKILSGAEPTGNANAIGSWPPAIYNYCGDPVLEWGGEPTAELVGSATPEAGSRVKFTFTGKNTGNAPLASPSITVDADSFAGTNGMPDFTCAPDQVAVDGTFDCTATYTLSATDLNSGALSITGEVSAKYNDEAVDASGSKTAIIELVPFAELTLNKTVAPPALFAEGEDATYTFSIRNSGDAEVTGISLVDQSDGHGTLGDFDCGAADYPVVSLGVGETATCTAKYTLAQDDIDEGTVTNVATAVGKFMNATRDVESNESTAVLRGERSPRLDFEVYSDYNTDEDIWAADTGFTYFMKVINNGVTTLDNVQVTKGAFGGTGTLGDLTCDPTLGSTLKPGSSMLCQVSYTLTQADVDDQAPLSLAGAVEAESIGETVSGSDLYTLDEEPIKSMSLVKAQSFADGDVWKVNAMNTYTLTITNTGTTTLKDVSLDDDGWTGSSPVTEIHCKPEGGPDGDGTAWIEKLAPGESTVCSFTYALRQADVDRGIIKNSATLTAKTTGGDEVGSVVAQAEDWMGVPSVELGLTKTAKVPMPFKAGSDVTYTFTVKNNGPGTATNVVVEDKGPIVNGHKGTGAWSGVKCDGSDSNVIASMASTASTATKTCTATYTLTQEDADAGLISNSAEVNGTDPNGNPAVPGTAGPITAGPGPDTQLAAAGLSVTVAGNEVTNPKVGDSVVFDVTVTNTGIVTVAGVNLALPAGFTAACSPVLPAVLVPEATSTCTVTGKLSTQAMVDAGSLTLDTTAVGTFNSEDVTSADASHTVTWTSTPALDLVKTVSDLDVSEYKAGTEVEFTYLVTNTGNSTLEGLTITETGFTGVGADGNPATLTPVCAEDSIAPGSTVECTAAYMLSQSDIDNAFTTTPGPLANLATATAQTTQGAEGTSDPSGAILGADDEGEVTLPAGSVEVTQKVVTQPANGEFKAGENVEFEVTVTNNGAVSLDSVDLTKTGTDGADLSCGANPFPLAPGGSYTCTIEYMLTQADADALSVTSTVTATGSYGSGKVTEPDSAVSTVTGTNIPKVIITKEATVDGALAAGATVNYKYTVTNTGDVSVSAVDIVEKSFDGQGDPGLSDAVCPAIPAEAPLAPGDSIECTATYKLVQADLNQGGVNNTAIATATAVGTSEEVSSEDSASAFTENDLEPALSLTGSATAAGSSAGDEVSYTFTVKNTGPVTVTGVEVDLAAFTGTNGTPTLTCDHTDLAPGTEATCIGSYTLTQDDVNAGSVTATGTATGTALATTVTSDQADANVSLDPDEGLMVSATTTKVPAADFEADKSVSIPVTVTNNGQTTISDVTFQFTDFDGTNGVPTGITCTPTTLDPGDIASCTVVYVLTQVDIDRGGFDFTVEATGTGSSAPTVTSTTDGGRVEGEGVFKLALDMTAGLDEGQEFAAGSTGTFTFSVENTGKVTVSDLTANKLTFDGSGDLGVITCQDESLAPGGKTTCTVVYTLTQEDVDNAGVSLSGNVSGQHTLNKTGISNNDSASINGTPTNKVAVTKTVARNDGSGQDPFTTGDKVTYTFALKNEGAGTLSGWSLKETAFGGSGTLGDVTCATDTETALGESQLVLAPGASATCTAEYALTATDLEKQVLTNTVSAGAKWGTTDVPVDTDSAALDIYVAPTLSLAVDATLEGSAFKAGETVNIIYTLTNDGPIRLTNHTVAQGFDSGILTRAAGPDATCSESSTPMEVGGTATCTSTYTLSQADVNAGGLTVTGQARAEGVETVTAIAEATAKDWVIPEDDQLVNEVTLEKSVTLPAKIEAGRNLEYSFKVTNVGYVNIDSFTVEENATAFTGTGTLPVPSCPGDTSLAPAGASGDSKTCTATYELTQADIDRGSVDNAALVNAQSTLGGISDSDSVEATLAASPGLDLVKTARDIDGGDFKVGGQLVFDLVATNTGNVTLKEVSITDTPAGDGDITDPACTSGDLSAMTPGAVAECSVTYTLTQADVDRGYVENAATASGTTPGGENETSEPGEATGEPTGEIPSGLSIVKMVSEPEDFKEGQMLTYSFKVTNTGNTTLRDVSVVEGAFTGNDGKGTFTNDTCTVVATLVPGADFTCTKGYVLSQWDVDSGQVRNAATATGTSPAGKTVESEEDEAVTSGSGQASMTFAKTAQEISSGDFKAGGTLYFDFRIENTGDVTLKDVKIDESGFMGQGSLGQMTCANGSLSSVAPGEVVTCTMPYTLTQADIDRGSVENVATATAKPSTGGELEEGPETATGEPSGGVKSGLQITKTVQDEPETLSAGEDIVFQFEVENTGNTTLRDVSVVEGEFTGSNGPLDVSSCTWAELKPDKTESCTATYSLTQDDVDEEFMSNKASATAKDPSGADVSAAESWTTINGTAITNLEMTKTAREVAEGKFAAGESVFFDFEVANTGTTTINNVVIDESEFSGDPANLGTVTCLNGSLDSIAPKTTLNCSVEYTLGQADVDRGYVDNRAQAQGETKPGKPVVSDPAEATSVPTGEITSSVSVLKTLSQEPATWKAGQAVGFHFLVTNTGVTTLRNVGVVEGAFTGTGALTGLTCAPVAYLTPGGTYECEASYSLTQADVDAGTVSNTASASAVSPEGAGVTGEDSTATVSGQGTSGMSLAKEVNQISAEDYKAGAKLVYTFTVTNTGDLTIRDVAIDESQFGGAGTLGKITCSEGSLKSIAPSETVVCSADYVLVQADIDAGSVKNTATAGGKLPGDGGEITTDPEEATGGPEGGAALSALSITKTVGEPAAKDFKAGATLNYKFVVTNTGNTTLTEAKVVEGDFTGTGTLSDVSCPDDRTLAPGGTMACSATYQMTQADVDAGSVTNQAWATALGPVPATRAEGGPLVTAEATSATTTVKPLAGLKLTKTASPIKDADFKVGTRIDYQFLVENIGNVTVTDIVVVEGEFTGSGQMSAVTCPEDPLTLEPGADATCTAYYTLTDADVKAGALTNTATVAGTLPGGGDLSGGGDGEFEITGPDEQESTAVLKPGGSLAVTGATVTGILGAGMLLLALGCFLVVSKRNPRGNKARQPRH